MSTSQDDPEPPLPPSALRVGFDRVVEWLLEESEVEPVSEDWVPGASVPERKALARLGSLVGAALQHAQSQESMISLHPDPLVRAWMQTKAGVDEDVREALQRIRLDGGEPAIAELYARVVAGSSRRTLGTFFTSQTVVRWMLEQWSGRFPAPRSVVDIGAGVGAFTTRASALWPAANVLAIDVNPVTLGLLMYAVNGLPSVESARVSPVLEDVTRWIPENWSQLARPRVLIGNPPYTRLQLLPAGERSRLLEAGGGLVTSRAALSAIITAQSLLALGEDDGLALLLPSHWLESDYAASMRKHIWDLRNRRVILRLFTNELFQDARVDAVALVIGPAEGSLHPMEIMQDDGGQLRVDRKGACPTNFRRLWATSSRPAAGRRDDVPLSDYMTVRRGVATGANKFFAIRQDVAASAGFPAEALVPLVRRLQHLPDRIDTRTLRQQPPARSFVLLKMHAKDASSHPAIAAYLSSSEAAEYQTRHLCQARATWHDLTREILIPDLIVGQSATSTFRLVENVAKATILNNLYGLTWKPEVPSTTRETLLAWLRGPGGQRALRRAARTHSSGLMKLEPRALSELRLPRPSRYSL